MTCKPFYDRQVLKIFIEISLAHKDLKLQIYQAFSLPVTDPDKILTNRILFGTLQTSSV